MPFVNPLELLGIPANGPAPDAETLRKARRAKLLEFDLSDGGVIHHGRLAVSRTDFQRACSDLDDPKKLAGYRALQRLPHLSAFLAGGQPALFRAPLPDWVRHPGFLDVIGLPFAERYASALASAVRSSDLEAVQALTTHAPLVQDHRLASLYEETERVLAHIVDDLNGLRREVEEADEEGDLPEIVPEVDVETLNALPSYFEGGRSRVAQSLRDLSVAVFNELDDVESARELICLAAELDVSPTTADRIRQDFEQIDGIRRQRLLKEQHAPALKAAADALVRLKALAKQAERADADLASIAGQARGLVDADALNRLPEEVAGARVAIALALRSIALTCWNEHGEAAAALALTRLAGTLRTDEDVRERLRDDLATLERVAREAEAQAAQEYPVLLSILLRVQNDTRGGLFGPNVNWAAVERLLDGLFDEGGLRLLRALKDPVKKAQVAGLLRTILERLGKHRPSGADRIAQRLTRALPDLAPTTGRSHPQPTTSTYAGPRAAVPTSAGSSAAQPPRTPGGPAAPPPKEESDGAYGAGVIVGAVVVLSIILIFALAPSGYDEGPYVPPVVLGDTMRVVVTAEHGPLSRIYIAIDGGPARPYWIEHGDSVEFDVIDIISLRKDVDDASVTVDGHTYPNRSSGDQFVITRADVVSHLSGPAATARTSGAPGGMTSVVEPTPLPEPAAPPEPAVSPFAGNQLTDGASPYDAYFGQGQYSSAQNSVTFLNGHRADVVVLLVDKYSGRTIRNEYIREGSSFTMTNVPSGTYFIRAFYGRDWNPDLPLDGGRIVGGFETDRDFSESPYDPLYLSDNGFTYSSYEVTLYPVRDGNMESNSISASSFFD